MANVINEFGKGFGRGMGYKVASSLYAQGIEKAVIQQEQQLNTVCITEC